MLAKLETLRAEKVIGKALEAVVTLYIGETEKNLAEKYAASLTELFNVSEVDILTHDSEHLPTANVDRSVKHKCDRCWRHVPDVGQQSKYPTVCLRCAEALDAIDFPPYSATATN